MNQFKKAKLKQLESGKPVEKVSDLQKAGIAIANQEPEKKEVEDTSISENIINTSKEIAEEKKEVENPIIPDNEPVSVQTVAIPVPKPVTELNTQAEITEPKTTTELNSTTTQISQENRENEETIAKKDELLAVETNIQPEPLPVVNTTPQLEDIPSVVETTQLDLPTINQVSIQPESQTISDSPMYTNMYTQQINEIEIVEKPHEPIITTTRLVERNAAAAAPVARTTAKKSIPNIFAPKDEAKSMRKSLVLKPTSVKKAESYCSKNGGSFNELIQTLLDNFIEEYGL